MATQCSRRCRCLRVPVRHRGTSRRICRMSRAYVLLRILIVCVRHNNSFGRNRFRQQRYKVVNMYRTLRRIAGRRPHDGDLTGTLVYTPTYNQSRERLPLERRIEGWKKTSGWGILSPHSAPISPSLEASHKYDMKLQLFERRITSCPVHLTAADSYEVIFSYKLPIQLVKLGPYHFVH